MDDDRSAIQIYRKVGIAFGEAVKKSKRSFVPLVKKGSPESDSIVNRFCGHRTLNYNAVVLLV